MSTLRQIDNVFNSGVAQGRVRAALLLVAQQVRAEEAPPSDATNAVKAVYAKRQSLAKSVHRNVQGMTQQMFPRMMQNQTLQDKAVNFCSVELSNADETQLDDDVKYVVSTIFDEFLDLGN
jgi:hypothetical protein